MNKLPSERRAAILAMMVEGVSIRSISRLTGANKNTIVKLYGGSGEGETSTVQRKYSPGECLGTRKTAVHALSIYFMHYNFVRIHQTLRVMPAMQAGVTDRLWSMDDVVAMIDATAPQPAKRGPYKKREVGERQRQGEAV